MKLGWMRLPQVISWTFARKTKPLPMLHLPDVAGMRLGDVDDEELNLIFVLCVKLVEGTSRRKGGQV